MTATSEVQSGLEGVVAFATEIAEPDRAGGALRYRGVDIEELVGNVPFEHVWGLLVEGHLLPRMPPAEPHPLSVRLGDGAVVRGPVGARRGAVGSAARRRALARAQNARRRTYVGPPPRHLSELEA